MAPGHRQCGCLKSVYADHRAYQKRLGQRARAFSQDTRGCRVCLQQGYAKRVPFAHFRRVRRLLSTDSLRTLTTRNSFGALLCSLPMQELHLPESFKEEEEARRREAVRDEEA